MGSDGCGVSGRVSGLLVGLCVIHWDVKVVVVVWVDVGGIEWVVKWVQWLVRLTFGS